MGGEGVSKFKIKGGQIETQILILEMGQNKTWAIRIRKGFRQMHVQHAFLDKYVKMGSPFCLCFLNISAMSCFRFVVTM